MKDEIRKQIEEYSIEDWENMAMRTDYAIEANEDTCKINEADAGAFYKEGFTACLKKWEESERWRKISEELPKENEERI